MTPERTERPAAFTRWATIAIIALPVLVRAALDDPERLHGDDLLTAYFSSRLNLLSSEVFGLVPPDPADWVAQFPAPFFALQKLFFVAFGESLRSIQFSVLPWVLAASAFLWAIAKELLDESGAFIAVFIYAFFGPSLYLETFGVMFVSSTAVFLAFLYAAVRELRSGEARWAIAEGLLAGAGFLFYLSSYVTLPIALLFFAARGSAPRERNVGRNLLLFTTGAVAVLVPLALLQASAGTGSLSRRLADVSLLAGAGGESSGGFVWQNLKTAVSELYQPNSGGHGGYEFGHQALLEPLIATLLVIGLGFALVRGWHRLEWHLVLVSIGLAFVTGVVLTVPPPAYHRISVVFPLIALLAAVPLHRLVSAGSGGRAIVAVVLTAFAWTHVVYFLIAALPERNPEVLRLARFVNERYPDRPLHVAAFPGFAFDRIYHFVPGKRASAVVTEYHATLLPKVDPQSRYLYVYTLPHFFDDAFRRADPNGRVIRFSSEYSVFVN